MKITRFLLIVLSSFVLNIASHVHRAKECMRILMVVAEFPKIHDICILNQIIGLIDRGHEVHICALRRGDCVNVQKRVMEYKLIEKTIFGALPDDLDQYDIVMFQLGHKMTDIRRSHNYRGKIVTCLRGYDITGYIKENPHAYDKYFETCDLFLPVCNSFKKILERIGCSPKKIVVHHSSIDCSQFQYRPKKIIKKNVITIVSAGRFVEKKGFIYSIQAVARLREKYPNIRYRIIGDGPLKKQYLKIIKKLGLEDVIQLENWYPHEEYINILNKSDIFILSSITAENHDQEGIPNVLKEAMAIGLPVVATDHSGNGELIENGVTGFLVHERDSDALYYALKYIINNPKKLPSIQENAVKKVHQEFEVGTSNDQLEKILYNLLHYNNQESNA
jgi:colanic acid/amylovoran biosynthesis glycosyltransferase